ncbi:MAG: hypothetical protein ACI96M_003377 [Candidatus Azotimanducaceae bacterium]|jgi:uncharacterized protein YbjT (DUF2867 family)
MKVLVIGANGNTATRVIRRLAESDHDPIAMIRNPSHRAKFDKLGVATVLADLEYPIDHIGAIRSMVAAQVHNVRRYIMLSSINNNINSQSPIAHYHRAKAHADNHLVESGLDYTIVCPGGLTDEAGTDLVSVDAELTGRGLTSRENLASVLVACLDYDNSIGKSFSLLDGDTPLNEALSAL